MAGQSARADLAYVACGGARGHARYELSAQIALTTMLQDAKLMSLIRACAQVTRLMIIFPREYHCAREKIHYVHWQSASTGYTGP